MENSLSWQECQIDASRGMEIPPIHDNLIYAMSLHLEERYLTLNTQYREINTQEELTDLRVIKVLAQYFDDMLAPSMLMDVCCVPIKSFLDRWEWLFLIRGKYNWPLVPYATLPELESRLESLKINASQVMGTCGLDGFVFAENVFYRTRTAPEQFG